MSQHKNQRPVDRCAGSSGPVAKAPSETANDLHSIVALSQRRRREAVILAVLALAAVLRLRVVGQPTGVVVGESLSMLVLFIVAAAAPRVRRWPRPGASWLRWLGAAAAMLVPLVSRIALQVTGGSPAAWEMVMLMTLGSAAIALALCSGQPRHAALSVICSGFLLLFTTAISDHVDTFYLSVLWILICLWWMLANHWEQLEVHLAHSVHRHHRIRLAMTMLGITICGLAVAATWGRGPAARMLDGGVMPTSGGNRWSDPGARSGVGDGDAVVAAKQHAASFGAVESELFLESRQPSLFDLFDDVLGKTKPVVRSEKAMSLANRMPRERSRRTVQSQQGSASLATARHRVQKRSRLSEQKSTALVQWVGPVGLSLAMQRYDHFDGIEWTQRDPQSHAAAQDAASRPLVRQELGERVWYFRPWSRSTRPSPLLGPARGDAVKFINLRSARIPAPATAIGVHIADVARDDFFAISADDSFIMPDRSHVPSLTVVRLVSHEIDADALHAIGKLPREQATEQTPATQSVGMQMAQRLAEQWSEGATTDWQRVESIVQRLRTGFVFDRAAATTAEDPLASFLTLRQGGDHLFATAAAVMLRSVGFQARLATGFYVPLDRHDPLTGHADLLSDDVHVWVELKADGDLWLPLEPTPGFAPPRLYRPFWKRVAAASWAAAPWTMLMLFSGLLGWRWRRVWGDWACRALWRLSWPLDGRRRLVLLVRLLDLRSRLAGVSRPAGVTPRRWTEQATTTADASLQMAVQRLFNFADAVFYGPQGQEPLPTAWLRDAEQIVSDLTAKKWINLPTTKMSNS